MSKHHMKEQGSRNMAQNNRGGNEGITPKRTGEKGVEKFGATTKRGSPSKG